ncbi:helix-turn-helix domain-containing protein [Lachnospiraceae bacterium ZAX-1]
MAFTFNELLLIPEMSKAKIVAGMGGQDKEIKGCEIAEVARPWEQVYDGTIIFLSGVGLKSAKEDLQQLIKAMESQNGAGLMIQKGEYMKEVPSSVKKLANEKNVVIIEIPSDSKIVKIMYHICNHIFAADQVDTTMDKVLKEVMYLDYSEAFAAKAQFYGYSSDHAYVATAVALDADQTDKNSMEQVIYDIKLYFEQFGKKVLYTQEESLLICMLPLENGQEYKSYLRKNIQKVKNQLKEGKQITISIGIGCMFHDIIALKRSSMEAKEALKMLHTCHKNDDVRMYDEMGIYRILFRVQDKRELVRILQLTLGPLLEWDMEYENDLAGTLELYLLENCNLSKTAETLYVHRNTLKYRIQKIQEILNCDLNDVQTCFNLRLVYKIKRFLEGF